MEEFDMTAKTLFGLEEVLAGELSALGASDVTPGRRMVSFRGDKSLMYRANYCLRTALRILKPIASFRVLDAEEVYEAVKTIEWEQYMTAAMTFAIDSVVNSEVFTHSMYVTYRVKDGIADYFNEKYGVRPSVRVNNPSIYINVHISHDICTVSLDSSGESLHRRGYRVTQGEAPLSEVLAAGMLLLSGWDGKTPFIDPMCGSGTLLIEAALIALNISPGVYRKEYAYERWLDYDAELFGEISEDDSGEREFCYKCYGSDVSPLAIERSKQNIASASLSKYIELKCMNFNKYNEAPEPSGLLVTNPPYGQRISPKDLNGLYSMIGERLKHVFTGYEAWIISSREDCFDSIGLHPKRKLQLMNGELQCSYRCYEMFAGKRDAERIKKSGVRAVTPK
jgi:putative N6-adenine-specific DNA methylase